jgi:dTDP-4-amino-4,6-dideoxygalactose transaminase
MVLTRNEEIAARAKMLRFHGMDPGSYSYDYVGYCSRLDEIQAAILRVKRPHVLEWNKARRANAAHYLEAFAELPIGLPVSKPENYHIYHQFTIRFAGRDELKAKLAARGVGSAVFYPSPIHLQKAYISLGYKPGDFPESEKAASEVLSLPVFPELTSEDRDQVTKAVREGVSEILN